MVAYFVPVPIMASGPPTTLTFVDSAQVQDEQITIPSSAQGGDLAVLVDMSVDFMTIPVVVPAGWTSIIQTGSTTNRRIVSRKVLESGDPGTAITGMDSSVSIFRKIMIILRPNNPITSVIASTWSDQLTDGNPSPQAVSASGQPAPLVVMASAGAIDNTSPAFSVQTPSFGATLHESHLLVGWTIYNSAPADQTVDMADLGNGNILQSGYIRVT